MDIYSLIFANSFKASIVASIVAENAWFAAVQFGGYNIWLATLAAIAGSSLGTLLNFSLGYYLGGKRGDWYAFSDKLYNRLTKYNRFTMFILIVPFSAIPVLGTFFTLYIVVAGFLRIPPKKAALLIVVGRVLYYLLCLVGVNA